VGVKTVEGRLNKGDFEKINVGDTIKFLNNEMGFHRQFTVKIIKTSISSFYFIFKIRPSFS
jgi:ASC-1-like (ASCH) protein